MRLRVSSLVLTIVVAGSLASVGIEAVHAQTAGRPEAAGSASPSPGSQSKEGLPTGVRPGDLPVDLQRLVEGEVLFLPRPELRVESDIRAAKRREVSPLGSMTRQGLMDTPPLVPYPETARLAWEQTFGRVKKIDDQAREIGEQAFADYPKHPVLAMGLHFFAGTPILPGLLGLDRLSPSIQWELLGEIEHTLGNTLAQLGRTDEAEKYLMRAAVSRARNLGEKHALTRSTLLSLLQLYERRGEADRAEFYRKKLGIKAPSSADSAPLDIPASAARRVY